MRAPLDPGVWAALGAAALFGAGAPFAKLLLEGAGPWLLAAILYLGAGLGLAFVRWWRQAGRVRPSRAEWGWLAGATLAGGVFGPVLLMTGLASMPAAEASLLLNMEGVLTAAIAWCVFRENVDRRVAAGMALIVAGAVALNWHGTASFSIGRPALAVLGACLAWAIDNNLTRKVSLTDASFIAMVKGLTAGTTNLAIACALGASRPGWPTIAAGALLGFVSYGASLVLFVVALRRLGTARAGAYFSVAPFFGATLGVAMLGETLTPALIAGGTLMALGVGLHLAERHAHEHVHEPVEHTHEHTHGHTHGHTHTNLQAHLHDPHHVHEHTPADETDSSGPHTHAHRHVPLSHSHPHYPDAHHRHKH